MGVEHTGVYPCFDRETMADLLDSAGLSWTYYMNGGVFRAVSNQSIWNAPAAIKKICEANGHSNTAQCVGTEYVQHVISTQAQILTDGTGPSWVASIVNSVGTQPACAGTGEHYWDDTAILIVWDDWGGWYDHVPPPSTAGWPNGLGAHYISGFRVPFLVVSAYTPQGLVENNIHDFGSILAFIEANFGLGQIGAGQYDDAFADNLSAFFTLSSPRSFYPVPAPLNARYFFHARLSTVGPDDD